MLAQPGDPVPTGDQPLQLCRLWGSWALPPPLQPCQAGGGPQGPLSKASLSHSGTDVIRARDTTDCPCFNSMPLVPMYLPTVVVQLSRVCPLPVFLSVDGLVNQSHVLLPGQWSLAAEGQRG